MKRTDFAARFEELGLKLGAYGDAAYFGEAEHYSLSLHPFPSEMVRHAKLAVNARTPNERSVVVNTFLSAADVKKTPEIEQAIERGGDFRGRIGPKEVSLTSIGSELVVNVMEAASN